MLFGTSCADSLLDREPLDKISETAVFSSASLVDANLLDLYADTQFRMPFDYGAGYLSVIIPYMGGELVSRGGWFGAENWVNQTAAVTESTTGVLSYWAYKHVRNINEFILKLEEATDVEDLDDNEKQIKLAEARFLRAYTYFEMVKRYGGVPLITKPQSQDLPEDELFVARDSEKEIYDFIASEMDELVDILPAPSSTETGRIHKYVALSLKSRAMLYAASIAEYGTQQLDGLLGFPSAEAQAYWQKSYDASKKIVNDQVYSLYNGDADKAKNFQKIFLDEGNSETIFAKIFNGKDVVGHSFDYYHWPGCDSRVGWGSEGMPYLESAMAFDYTDGRKGTEDLAVFNSDELINFNELYQDKDPRFHACINYPGGTFSGCKIYAHSGTYFNGETITSVTKIGDYDGEAWYGKSGWSRFQDKTGFGLKKFLDEDNGIQVKAGESDTDWLVYRYAETLLNLAEAAFELNKLDEAKDCINQLRLRAGMPEVTGTITMDEIRHERFVELMFEDQHYWDLVRWRTAVEELSFERSGIKLYFDWDTKKYDVMVKENAENRLRTFEEKHYYLPISLTRISNNSNLAPENPGYSD